MPTIRDVAKEANVSVSTVSNILNHRANVSEAKYQRVMDAIEKLKYNPNFLASNLKTNNSKIIAIIIPELTMVMRHVIMEIIDTMSNRGYLCLLRQTHYSKYEESLALEEFQFIGVAGIFLSTCDSTNHSLFETILAKEIPLIFIENYADGPQYASVIFDNISASRHMFSKVLNTGLNKDEIMILCGPQDYNSESDCLKGIMDAGGTDIPIYHLRFSEELAYIDFSNILSKIEPLPKAIITTCNEFATAAKRVFDDYHYNSKIYFLSVDRFEETQHSSFVPFPRNTLKMGKICSNMMFSYINSPILFEKQRTIIRTEYKKPYPFVTPTAQKRIKVFLFDGPTSVALTKTFRAFEHTANTKMEYELLSYSDLYNVILKTSETGHSDADIFMVDYHWKDVFANQKYFHPIEKLMEKMNPNYLCTYPPNIQNLFTEENGHIYMLPAVVNVQLLFYRKDIFNRTDIKRKFFRTYGIELAPPKTWRDFEVIAQFFTQKFNSDSPVPYGTTLQGYDPVFMSEEFFPRQWAFNGKFISSTNHNIINSIENSRALLNLKNVYECTPKLQTQSDWLMDSTRILNNEIAMYFTFSTHIPSINTPSAHKIDYNNIGIAPAPGKHPLLGGWYLGISKFSKNVSEATKFIDWLSFSENAISNTLLGLFIPKNSVFDSTRCQKIYPWIQHLQHNLALAKKREIILDRSGNIIDLNQIDHIIFEAIQYLFASGDINGAMQIMHDKVEALRTMGL